ncbi:MAG: enediyne polyketide synthase [Thermoleophilaceae bacterium]|nr:enediyne polyketide synthase [Thermoleophilaceae bacterium]
MAAERPQLALFGADRRSDLRRALADLDPSPAGSARWRAAIVHSSPDQLAERAERLRELLDEDQAPLRSCPGGGAYLGAGQRARIGVLFPGQGAPVHSSPGAIEELVPEAGAVYAAAQLPAEVPPELVQLAVVTSSVSALRALRALGIEPDLALGHSLGELTALHWGGAFDEDVLLRMARARGEVMTAHASAEGGMVSLRSSESVAEQLVEGLDLVVGCFNAPAQHVVSGPAAGLDAVLARAKEARVRAVRLGVVGAFHSPLMRPAVAAFERHLDGVRFEPLQRAVFSSVTGGRLDPNTDLHDLLARQIEQPVRFTAAAAAVAEHVDLFVEAGPGKILTGLLAPVVPVPGVALCASGGSVEPIYEAAAAASAGGVQVRIPEALAAA